MSRDDNYLALQRKYRKHLKSRMEYLGSDDFLQRCDEEAPDMVAAIPYLQQMNGLGYLTYDSQQGTLHRGSYGELHERAYISGFMQKSIAEKFIKLMGIQTDKVAIYSPCIPMEENKIFKLPSSLHIPLTLSKPKNSSTTVATHNSFVYPWSWYKTTLREAGLFGTFVTKNKNVLDLVLVCCYDTTWNRLATLSKGNKGHGLFTDVINILSLSTK